MSGTLLSRLSAVVEDYLLAWVLLSVAVGAAIPRVGVVTEFSTLILAVMIGSVSLTLTVGEFREIRPRSLGAILVGHALMPFLAFGVARLLGLSPELTVGFVILGAVTPELVTPVMTELAGGKTALSTTALVLIGVASVGFVPAVASLLLRGSVRIEAMRIVEQLVVALVVPMGLAIGIRAIRPSAVAPYDEYYPSISALMVVIIIGGVTATNAEVIRSNRSLLLTVVAGALALNVVGYGVGWFGSAGDERSVRIASLLSVGMRDFAVAAALVVAAGLPAIASLPAVAFGVVEMVTSAGVARYFDETD